MPGGRKRKVTGLEWAAGLNSLSFQSEYKTQTVDNELNKDYKANAFYVLGSYFLTGEHRPYKNGAFGKVKPKKILPTAAMVLLRF